MVPVGERLRVVLIAAVAILLVGGTSFAIKKFVKGNDPAGLAKAGYLKYADYGGAVRPGQSGGCGGSCCSGKAGGGGFSSADAEKIKVEALKYYSVKYGDGDVTCEVRDYGCHQEAEIIKDGAVVKKLSINGGRITEI